MCVYYVESMCAGRIGLGWAHDVFTITCHIFIHFSCIRTFNSLCFVIDLCWYFSLSLQLACSMAPKRKSTPSWNPLRFEATSSSPSADSTPSYVWFCDEKAHTNFSKNFSRRGIHSECQVVLLNFSDTNLPTVIYNRGWESLYGILVTCPFMII